MIHKEKNKALALIQIFILIIGIVAISWMIGGEVGIVSADGGCETAGYTCIVNSGQCPSGTIKSTDVKYSCEIGKFCCVEKVEVPYAANGIPSLITTPLLATAPFDKLWAKYLGDAAEVATTAGTNAGTTTVIGGEIFDGFGNVIGGVTSPGSTTLTSPSTGHWYLGGGGQVGSIIAIAAWSATAFMAGRYILGPVFGLDTSQSSALGYALAAGTATTMILSSKTLGIGKLIGITGGWATFGIGAAVSLAIFAILSKKTSVDVIQSNCYQWDAQSGKDLSESQRRQRCETCNDQEDFACTEYQCRSLGQGCVLINEEDSGKQLCIWNNTRDITPPIISPWEDALLDNFAYTPVSTFSNQDKGVQIKYIGNEAVTSDGNIKCAPPYTPISFGVQLDEPAKCKVSPLRIPSYEEMADIYLGRGIRDYEHSFALSLPSKEALEAENITVDNGGKYELYVRCQDANGNSNANNFLFKFCLSEGPDTTPPLILGTNILNDQPIAHGQQSVDIELYVNEPSECKWSHLDKSYEAMEENMTCATSVTEINSQLMYTCKDELTGLKDNQNNNFYFKCKDQPHLKGTDKEGDRNFNRQSYSLNLIGTQPLVIGKVGPEGTIEDSTNAIKVTLEVETSAGYDEGKAVCAFSETGASGSYIDFFYGQDIELFSQYEHFQELWLGEGDYTYFIKCRDEGGNVDTKEINFDVKTDTASPTIVRVYKDDEYLEIITDENGDCVYSNFGCNYLFDDGTQMSSINEKKHYTGWDINKDFYIKCKDDYGNMPLPNACSIIARPFEIFTPQ